MAKKVTGNGIEGLKPGAKLTLKQGGQVAQLIGESIEDVSRRRKGILLVHDSLQKTIGLFFQMFNWEVGYEVPFEEGGWSPERMVFDIVAQKGRQVRVIEVKDEVKTRDLGQVAGYIDALKLSGQRAKVYLGTDLLNYDELLEGTIGQMTRDLMQRQAMGVILADKYLLVYFHTYSQLVLEEMPEIWISEDKVE